MTASVFPEYTQSYRDINNVLNQKLNSINLYMQKN